MNRKILRNGTFPCSPTWAKGTCHSRANGDSTVQPEAPQRNDIAETRFDVVLHDIGIVKSFSTERRNPSLRDNSSQKRPSLRDNSSQKRPSLRDLSSDMGLGHALSSAYGKHRHIAGSHFPIRSFSLEFPATMGMEKRWAYGSLSTSAKVLEYSRGSTRVLSGQYSSTSIGVLEYSYWSTRVFLLKYSDALRSSPPTPLFSSTKDGR